MSNNYFQFKQFRIEQHGAAMKVSTDACIQGAWTPIYNRVKTVVDIGTGTGLLSLMLAQRNNELSIDAIELNNDAAKCAEGNIENSPWGSRLRVINNDALVHHYDKKYDLLISNPPFFQNSLQSKDDERTDARHNTTLDYHDLIKILDKTVSDKGYASILLPFNEHEVWEQLLHTKGWQVFQRLVVKPRKDLRVNRVVSLCCRKGDDVTVKQVEELIIYDKIGEYSAQFIKIMKPFYLKL